MVHTSEAQGNKSQEAERDWRDETGIHSVHVALFSHVSRFTRHRLWHCWIISTSCQTKRSES